MAKAAIRYDNLGARVSAWSHCRDH